MADLKIDINWETLRKQTAPIIPEVKHETDTTNFARMQDKINEKEKESPFDYVSTDHKANPNVVKKTLLLGRSNSK